MNPTPNNYNENPGPLVEIDMSSPTGENSALESVPTSLQRYISAEIWSGFTYEQRALLKNLDSMPGQLMGIVPESVWPTLSIDQKIEFLYSFNLIPRGSVEIVHNQFEGSTFDGGMGEAEYGSPIIKTSENLPNEPEIVETSINIAEEQNLKTEFKEAVKEVEILESAHKVEMESFKDDDQINKLSSEEKARIDQETGASFSKSKSFATQSPKLTGYKANDQIINNLDQYIDGPADRGTTWTAHIVRKIISAFSS